LHKREDVPLAVVKAGVFEVWVYVWMYNKKNVRWKVISQAYTTISTSVSKQILLRLHSNKHDLVRLNFHIVNQISFNCEVITCNNTEFGFRMKHNQAHLVFDLMVNGSTAFL